MILILTLLLPALLVPPTSACDIECERQAVLQLLEAGEARTAIDRLRAAKQRFPDEPVVWQLMAKAYISEGNLFWAERTLSEGLERWPDNQQLRSWLVCLHLRQGDPELALSVLHGESLQVDGPEQARRQLLQAFALYLDGDREEMRLALAEVPRSSRLYPEDRPVWRGLHQRGDRLWRDSLSTDLELVTGWTSNALAGAPTDPSGAGTGSALGDVELRTRVTPPLSGSWSPQVELDLTGHMLEEQEYRELSSLDSSLRLAGTTTNAKHRLTIGYRAELLLLDQDDATYAEAHRGELELESRSGRLLFAGAGHRSYRDPRRSRWEADLGFGGPLRLSDRLTMLLGATVRWADAESPAYDQLGASLVVAGQVGLGKGFTTRLAGTVTWDDYPNSGGLEGQQVFHSAEPRKDLLGRLKLELAGPVWHGLQPILIWQYSRRDSTVDELPMGSFDFTESRVALRLRWSFTGDPWAPATISPPGHLPLDWGLRLIDGETSHPIIELLRQDEELHRGSSCQVF